jgi:hypothetical protein
MNWEGADCGAHASQQGPPAGPPVLSEEEGTTQAVPGG